MQNSTLHADFSAPVATLQAGFSNPVLQAQESFRALLKAMSEPTTVQSLGLSRGLEKIYPSAYDLLLSLSDSDTKVWISPALDSAVVRQNLAFHCACPITTDIHEADFALLTRDDLALIAELNNGTDRDPELSCTALIQVPSVTVADLTSPVTQWRGPGIESPTTVQLALPQALWTVREQVNQFPRGIDMVFCAQQDIIALPRSTQVIFAKD